MEGEVPPQAGPAADPSRSVLGCALRWLGASDTVSLPLSTLLAELAAAFGASGGGVASSPAASPLRSGPRTRPFPGASARNCSAKSRLSPTSLPVRDGGTHWLLTAVGGDEGAGWLLWLEAPAAREWSPAEAAALALTGRGPGPPAAPAGDAPRWARRCWRGGGSSASTRRRRPPAASPTITATC